MNLSMLTGLSEIIPDALGSVTVAGLASNTTDVKPGYLFFGLPGTNVDGATFVSEAEKSGACAAVVSVGSDVGPAEIPVFRSEMPRYVLAKAAAAFYGKQPETIAAVTGTAGKTSVANFVRQIWESEGIMAASLGTTGVEAPGMNTYGNLTTPDPIYLHALLSDLSDAGVTHVAMEASSHGLDQSRLDGVALSVAGFTNLGRDHLDYHSDMKEYLEAKLLLFTQRLPQNSPAIIFADDAYSEEVIARTREAGRTVLTVGREGDYIALKKVEHHQFNQVVELMFAEKLYRIEFPLAGDFQIANALVAAGMAISTGANPETVFKTLEGLKGASGRLELVGKTSDGAPAYVDYAHKPEALENVLKSLRPFASGRLILVFGCGGDRDKGKRPIMGEIADRLADIVIVTDDNPRTEDPSTIRAEILAACESGIEIGDRAEAIQNACGMLQVGDCLVVAGKGHEPGQIVGSEVLPFSDHEVLRAAIKEKAA
ncbi:MAG: UDP-N-acetylmuramoyl-L-alanyl-D-glutamate--2,6-diaminopimelate ligase [Pseudomonadota bacterium]